MPLWGRIDQANNRPKFDNGANVVGITAAELVPGIEHAGWVKNTAGTGPINAVNVTAGGTGYTDNAVVTFTGGGGSGAAATTRVTGGVITSIVISNPGSGYTSAPTVTAPTGTGATFSVVLGGRAGRVDYETLVAMGSMTNP